MSRVATRRALWNFDTEAYMRRVLETGPIAYWPLDESTGVVARDVSGNGYHGAYTSVDLGQAGIGDGRRAPFFDGASEWVDIYSAGLAGAFDGDEGTLHIWWRVANIGVWTDANSRDMFRLASADTSDGATWLNRLNQNDNLFARRNGSGVTTKGSTITGYGSRLNWLSMGITFSVTANEQRHFVAGLQAGLTLINLPAWSGALASAYIGAAPGPTRVWHGWLAHAALWDRALTPVEMATLAVIR